MPDRGTSGAPRELIEGPPPADQAILERLSKLVNVRAIDLIRLDFSVVDDSPIPPSGAQPRSPSGTGVDVSYALSDDGLLFGCVFSFFTESSGDNGWELSMSYRVSYDVVADVTLGDDELQQFLWWDALITVWPFYREQLVSTVQRAGLPTFIVATLPALTSASG